jgi:hypothetical protein
MSKLLKIASAVSSSLVSKYNTFLSEVATDVAAMEADKTTTTTTYDANIVAISDAEVVVQGQRATDEAGLKVAKAAIVTGLKTGSVDANVMESLLELEQSSSLYKAKYGVDLTTATTEASASRAAFNTELGPFTDFSGFFDEPKGK